MRVGILTIGNELISGRIQDANAFWIARELNIQGWQVPVMLSVGDQEDAIRDALHFGLSRSEAVIVTGGLGPTVDDITTAVVARVFDRMLYTDEAVLVFLKEIFSRYGLTWTDNNAKQASFPEGSEVIPNPVGTAAGFALKVKGKMVAVVPGVPGEMKRMIPEGVIPLLHRSFPGSASHVMSRTIKLFGLSEAGVDDALADAGLDGLGLDIGFYPNFPENHLVLTAREADTETAAGKLQEAERRIVARLGNDIFGYDQDSLEGIVARELTQRGLTLAVAESCTGGLITDRLTDIPGSSAFLERGVITYSNFSKMDLLGVPFDILKSHGAVNEPTARWMAEAVRKNAGTDLGLSATGIAGPAGGSAEKPVGTVYVALADVNETVCRHFRFRWERRRVKVITSEAALMMLKRYLFGENIHG
ncbi:MAG: competence/damage-inducible protein A [Syntrophales bacterium]|jgi:nicotinamide-nucleotide amidase